MPSTTVPTRTREIHLASRPDGAYTPENLKVVEAELPAPSPGEIVVRNDWMLLATAYRELMNEQSKLPLPPFQVGAPLTGRTVGTVVQSNSPDLAAGDLVEHFMGWREHVVLPAEQVVKRDAAQLPTPAHFLANGPTAWQGMVDIADVQAGETVFVSGATSGVGSLAGQIAKCRGAGRVIGSTGSKEKVRYLVEELGFDAAFDYHDGPVLDQLRELAPDGINVFFDNVGGEQFEAAVQVATPYARFALCGALGSQLGDPGETTGPRLDLLTAIGKQLALRPFACFHTPDQIAVWNKHFAQWLDEGRFVFPHTVVEGGLPYAPQALASLLDRAYSGNVVLALQA